RRGGPAARPRGGAGAGAPRPEGARWAPPEPGGAVGGADSPAAPGRAGLVTGGGCFFADPPRLLRVTPDVRAQRAREGRRGAGGGGRDKVAGGMLHKEFSGGIGRGAGKLVCWLW